MSKTNTIAATAALLALGGAGGWGLSQWAGGHATAPAAAASAPAAQRKVLYWYDPMVPTQRFDKPGKSPFMDMQLVPRYADEDDLARPVPPGSASRRRRSRRSACAWPRSSGVPSAAPSRPWPR